MDASEDSCDVSAEQNPWPVVFLTSLGGTNVLQLEAISNFIVMKPDITSRLSYHRTQLCCIIQYCGIGLW